MGRIFGRGGDVDDLPADAVRASAAPMDKPRSMRGAAVKIDLSKSSTRSEINRPTTRAWQRAAWDYYDAVGEVKFGFNMVASIMSRIRIFPAVVSDLTEQPIDIKQWAEEHEEIHSKSIEECQRVALAAIEGLNSGFVGGGIPEFMREATLNIGVAGEFFLLSPYQSGGKWYIASIDELREGGAGGGYVLQPTREAGAISGIPIDKMSYVARAWRTHPRWSAEPESSMLGVLDQLEKLVLFDRTMRTIARSKMHAGAMFIPDGITVKTMDTESDEESVEVVLQEGLAAPTTDEGAMTSISPVFLVGPAEQGKEIKRIDLGREIDPEMVAAQKDALNRTLQGLDFPKDIVTGLADVKYSNAIVIDDNLYRAHIEPMALLLVDILTEIFLRPILRKAGVPDALVNRCVIWYDPSDIVTRPDRSSAANEGYDRGILSADAWREARGFADTDAPDPEELLMRSVFNKGQLPQEVMVALLEHFAPEIFAAIRATTQAAPAQALPAEVSQALSIGQPGEPVTNPENTTRGELPTGGALPPRAIDQSIPPEET